MKKILIFLLISLTQIVSSASAECYADSALYVLNSDSSFTAGFDFSMSDDQNPIFYVNSEKTGRRYWFVLNLGNGWSDVIARPIVDSEKEKGVIKLTKRAGDLPALGFYEINDRFKPSSMLPMAKMAAPAHLFLPQLGNSLYYFGLAFSDRNDENEAREQLPLGLFSLKKCK